MNDTKHLIIHFNNGTKMEIAFPTQVKSSLGALVELSKRFLESDKLVIQTDDRVLVIPWSSVKLVEGSAIPSAALPLNVIKGARLVEATDAPPA